MLHIHYSIEIAYFVFLPTQCITPTNSLIRQVYQIYSFSWQVGSCSFHPVQSIPHHNIDWKTRFPLRKAFPAQLHVYFHPSLPNILSILAQFLHLMRSSLWKQSQERSIRRSDAKWLPSHAVNSDRSVKPTGWQVALSWWNSVTREFH